MTGGGRGGHEFEPTLQHVAVHLAKYAGKLAEIAEHLDHKDNPEKQAKARKLARHFIHEKRHNGIKWCAAEAARLCADLGFDGPPLNEPSASSAPPLACRCPGSTFSPAHLDGCAYAKPTALGAP